jgi:hypothetical protein
MSGYDSKRQMAADKLQEPDLTAVYMSGLYDGKKKKRPWVGLTDEEIHGTLGYNDTREMYQFAFALIAKLKERNS